MITENLINQEALKKMKDLIENIKIAFLLTNLNKHPINAVPMTTKKVDDNGNILFLSRLNSEHNINIANSPEVQLLYGHPSDLDFISIYGHASIIYDKKIIKELYTSEDDAWINDENDPNLTVLKIIPQEAYFWDSKENTFNKLFKRGMAAVKGEKPDTTDKKGKINL